ncbi:IS3 family transposase [Metabacillus halosaccharovorans]|uniref:IS3 family transposase n=1 Tax=Metabacillus halosaccharovorans TaxID=930124 RepID=UPI00204183EA|nr:IS3 family transposase [Metabacillus halosaccharovorans]MCM3444839.1 IS3 family transposase [Metabacillus halosaccharovorans]
MFKKVTSFSDESGRLSRKAQTALSFELKEKFKLKDVLKIVGIPESSYHYHMKMMKKENPNQELEECIQSMFEEHEGNYGYRRICLDLKQRGLKVNHKKVLRIMKKLGLKCDKFSRKTRKYSSYKGTVGTIAKNRINRRFHTSLCHQKLTTDITEFKCSDGKLYFNPIMDMFNSEIVSYGISMRPNLELAIKPLEEALEIVKESKYRTTIHSDQGWHYQHKKWTKTLKKHKVFQSMSRKGNCLDNSPMENFFGLLKQEMYYGEAVCSFEELKKRIEEYIIYYNNKRIKQKLAGMSPVQFRIHTSQLAA